MQERKPMLVLLPTGGLPQSLQKSILRIHEEIVTKTEEICQGWNQIWAGQSWGTYMRFRWGNYWMVLYHCTSWALQHIASTKFNSFFTGKRHTICDWSTLAETTSIWAEPDLWVYPPRHSQSDWSLPEHCYPCLYPGNVLSQWRGWIWSSEWPNFLRGLVRWVQDAIRGYIIITKWSTYWTLQSSPGGSRPMHNVCYCFIHSL